MSDPLAFVLGLALTLAVFSYLLGDNPVYRLAVHVLVGITAAYGLLIALRHVIIPALTNVATNPSAVESILWIIPLLLALLLLLRTVPRLTWIGQSTIGALTGIGAAVALTGAVAGTLVPQVLSVARGGDLLSLVAALLTICTLLSFRFTQDATREEAGWLQVLNRSIGPTGRLVLAISFGALFASALSTSLLLLTERIDYFLRLAGI